MVNLQSRTGGTQTQQTHTFDMGVYLFPEIVLKNMCIMPLLYSS